MGMKHLNNGQRRPMYFPMVKGHPAALRRTESDESAHPVATGPRKGSAGERGAAIVEFALVAVVLFTIIFGLIEGGLLVRARNAVASSADEAARRGAIAGSSVSADWQILQQLRVRGILSATQIDYVVVYKATDARDEPSDTCKAGTPVSGECNIYERADFELPSGSFTCADAALDGSWCPTTRAQDSSGFEYLGILVYATHSGLTGVFGDVELGAQSVLPLEGSGGV